MVGIIVKKYNGYNRAIGKYITSKRHYMNEMAKGGYIPFEKAESIAHEAEIRNRKEYRLSDKAMGIIKSANSSKDSEGNVKVEGRMIDAMKEVGVNFNLRDKLPKHYQENNKGRFE